MLGAYIRNGPAIIICLQDLNPSIDDGDSGYEEAEAKQETESHFYEQPEAKLGGGARVYQTSAKSILYSRDI